MSIIRNEQELVAAIAKVRPLVSPFFQVYRELFKKYLDLTKFPLAVENIMVVEELVESPDQLALGDSVDSHGTFSVFEGWDAQLCSKKQETLLG